MTSKAILVYLVHWFLVCPNEVCEWLVEIFHLPLIVIESGMCILQEKIQFIKKCYTQTTFPCSKFATIICNSLWYFVGNVCICTPWNEKPNYILVTHNKNANFVGYSLKAFIKKSLQQWPHSLVSDHSSPWHKHLLQVLTRAFVQMCLDNLSTHFSMLTQI